MVRSVRFLFVVLVAVGVGALVYLAAQTKTPPAYHGPTFQVATNAALPSQPSSLWIGDSYTAGTGASSQATAESCLTAQAMGWICNVDAQGGTGFVNPGPGPDTQPLPKRLAADKAQFLADVVIVDAGRNDGTLPESQIEAAAAREFAGIHKDWPKARIVAIVPYYMNGTGRSAAFAAFERAQMAKYHGIVVDPVAEGWISASKTASMTISDHVHPNPAGHRDIARHLTADFRRNGLTHLPVTDRPTV